MTGRNIRSRLDKFLCLVELAEHFPLADVRSLPRPLSNHTPLVWVGNKGIRKPTYFKMDRSTSSGGVQGRGREGMEGAK